MEGYIRIQQDWRVRVCLDPNSGFPDVLILELTLEISRGYYTSHKLFFLSSFVPSFLPVFLPFSFLPVLSFFFLVISNIATSSFGCLTVS